MVMTEIELKRSLLLLALQLVMGALAALAIGLADLPRLVQPVLTAVLLGALGLSIWQWRRPLPGLRIKASGQVQIDGGKSGWQDVTVLPGSFVSPGLGVVRLRSREATHRLVLLPDSASADVLRRLRLSLRWAPRTRSDTAFPDAG